jgi:hypothetical protein
VGGVGLGASVSIGSEEDGLDEMGKMAFVFLFLFLFFF